jgi:6-phosphogluconate dehydrogenase
VTDYEELCGSISKPRLLIFSLPHGGVGDKVMEGLMPHLERNDIILDCGNEHYMNTERRQEKCKDTGIRYIGCGVSGGYQAARAGPSMCPGGDISAIKEIMPLLEKAAAKDKDGKPCVGVIGTKGAGHYVKMIHNGIEHGMMSAICEAWGIMRKMGMGYEEIGDVFSKWNDSGEFVCWLFSSVFPMATSSITNSSDLYRKVHSSSPSALTSPTNANPATMEVNITALLSSPRSWIK